MNTEALITPASIHCRYLAALQEVKPTLSIHNHSVDIENRDTIIQYINTIRDFWLDRFTNHGISLLPHHFMIELFACNNYYDHIKHTLQSSHLRLEAMNVVYTHASRDLEMTPVAELYPMINSLDPNHSYDIPYGFDVAGDNLNNLTQWIFGITAIEEALMLTDVPLQIRHNPYSDPFCLNSGAAGTGLHCRARFIEQLYDQGKPHTRGDLQVADTLIDALQIVQTKNPAVYHALHDGSISWVQPEKQSMKTNIEFNHYLFLDSPTWYQIYFECKIQFEKTK